MNSSTSQLIPEGFVLTEVGMFPDDWEVKPLRQLSDYKNGKSYESFITESGDYYLITLNSLDIHGKLKSDHLRVNKCDGSLAKDDLVMILSDVAHGNFLGLTDVITSDNKYVLNQRVGALKNIRLINPYLLSKYINYHQKYFKIAGQGSSQQNLSKDDILNFNVAFPKTKTEQSSISSILKDIEALIEKLEKLIAKKKAIKQGAMQELLTGKRRLPGFSGIWETKILKEISYIKGRIGWQGLNQKEFTMKIDQPFLITGMNFKDGDIRWNEVYHVSEERYEIAKEIQLKNNDVLMTKDGTIGKMLFVTSIPYPYKATLNSHLLVFRPIHNSYDPKYLYYQMSSKSFRDHVELNKSGSTFFGLSQEAVGVFNVYLPPTVSEQKAIANIIYDMEKEIAALQYKLNKFDEIKQSAMQVLLTGKVRLIKN